MRWLIFTGIVGVFDMLMFMGAQKAGIVLWGILFSSIANREKGDLPSGLIVI